MTNTNQRRKHSRRQKEIKSVMLFVRISRGLRYSLKTIAQREERNLSQVARLAFRDFIEKRAATV